MQRKNYSHLLLTAGLALVFGVFGIQKLTDPLLWIGWMPAWLEGFLGLTREGWLTVIGISEILMAILLLIPVRLVRQIGATLISLHLIAILTQTGFDQIGIRDLGLLTAALALLCLI